MHHDLDDVLDVVLAFWVSRTVMAGVELGAFDQPGVFGPANLGLAERPGRALLDTCVATGLLRRADGGYERTERARRWLAADSEMSLRGWVRDERWCWDAWGRLEQSLQANAQALPPDAEGYHDFPEDFFLDFLHGSSLAMGAVLAEQVDLSAVRRIMDVGGGSGAVSISLCRRFPELEAVVVDQPPVLATTVEHVAAAGLAARIAVHAGNIFADPLPSGCDGAVIANVLHDFSPEKAQVILRRVHEALAPGAPLLILEMAPADDRSAPPVVVAFAVAMVVNTAGGDAYTVPQYRSWLEAAGFDVERVRPTGSRIVTTIIEARRR